MNWQTHQMFTRWNNAVLWVLCMFYVTVVFKIAEFLHWCKHKKALFKQKEAETLLGVYTLGSASNPLPFKCSKKGSSHKSLSLFSWSYLSSYFVSLNPGRNILDGVEKHLGNVGQSGSPNTTVTVQDTNPKRTACCTEKWIYTKLHQCAS